MTVETDIAQIITLAKHKNSINSEQARKLLKLLIQVFKETTEGAEHPARQILRITTKFRDAGRRSAPWKPTSSRVPGRPQDGADGNRINRWLLPSDHKFYATEVNATLVEAKYYLQALSLENAPRLPNNGFGNHFNWLTEHPIQPGAYLDPIQLIPIDFHEVVREARSIQSGHLVPLDRGGRHEPQNAFLMLARSNQLQGNLTLAELIKLMEEIVTKHKARHTIRP